MSTYKDIDKEVNFQLVQPPKATVGAVTVPATYIDVSLYDWFAFILAVGAAFDRTTYTMQVVQATAAAGTGSKNLTGALSTTPTAANKMEGVVCRAQALDTANGFRYVAVTTASAGGTTDVGTIWFLGWRGRYLAVSQTDLESVVRV